MMQLEEALNRILAAMPQPGSEEVSLACAEGRVAAEEVRARIDLPRFDNSAMDGYAVQAAETRGATAERPVALRLVGRVAAGSSFSGRVGAGECVRLFTGSPMPEGADAVVMQEDTTTMPDTGGAAGSTHVRVLAPVEPGESVRARGGDVRSGTTLLNGGDMVGVGHLALMAASGVERLLVGMRPRVAVLATGSELREPRQSLAPGQIYESNRHALAALVGRAGGLARVLPIVPDTLSDTRQALTAAFETADMIVTCGGVSVGEMDFVKAAFQELGGALEFWRVAIKPGKPFVFGRLGSKYLLGLPGNPVSALVTFLLLARPALLRWQGAAVTNLPVVPGVATEALPNPGERRHFIRVRLDPGGGVRSAGTQASHILSSLARAQGLVDVPAGKTIEPGSPVDVLLFGLA